MLKILKSIIFNLLTKKYKIFTKRFLSSRFIFLHMGLFFAHHCKIFEGESDKTIILLLPNLSQNNIKNQ